MAFDVLLLNATAKVQKPFEIGKKFKQKSVFLNASNIVFIIDVIPFIGVIKGKRNKEKIPRI